MRAEEYEGYCCLAIAILCNVNASEAQKMYHYGPYHPLCKKIMKKKVPQKGLAKLSRQESRKVMKKLLDQGYTVDAVADAFLCFPSTVRRRVKEVKEVKEEEEEDMHLHKFAELASFEEIACGGTLGATEEYRSFFKKLHPSQFLNSMIRIPIYEVKYSYFTARRNYRVGYKYMFLRLEHEEVDIEVEMAFQDWVDDLNKRKPYRKISNVRILEIKPIAYASFRVGF